MPPAPSDCRKSLKSSLAADTRRRQRHRQGNFAANCVRGALATSARFAVKFCQRAAEPSAACGGCSEAKQGQRSQSTSTLSRTPCDSGTATRTYTRGNSRVRRLPCAAVAPCAACRVSRHAGGCGAGARPGSGTVVRSAVPGVLFVPATADPPVPGRDADGQKQRDGQHSQIHVAPHSSLRVTMRTETQTDRAYRPTAAASTSPASAAGARPASSAASPGTRGKTRRVARNPATGM